jgi:cysteine-rich repeat protein
VGREAPLDALARDLASGELSRRSALKRLAAAGLGIGAALGPAGAAEALGGGCPGDRVKCDGKCCPKNARCRRGKCKCKRGFTKCGRKCVDTDTSVKHCGACADPCAAGETCVDGVCTPPASCSDAFKNGNETDVDCGGPDCPKCADSKACLSGTDCLSGACVGNVCAAASCADAIQNGQETDIDCGGPDCPGCVDGQMCVAHSDCQSGNCVGGICVAQGAVCGNGIVEAGEECDDGGTNDGDGCSSFCAVEPGWQCTGSPSVCTPI